MNGGERRFEHLVAAARRELTPVGDVSAAALTSIQDRRGARWTLSPMLVCAAAYGLICVVGLGLAFAYLSSGGDPMTNFFAMASEIAP